MQNLKNRSIASGFELDMMIWVRNCWKGDGEPTNKKETGSSTLQLQQWHSNVLKRRHPVNHCEENATQCPNIRGGSNFERSWSVL